jgi:hypothetical protein
VGGGAYPRPVRFPAPGHGFSGRFWLHWALRIVSSVTSIPRRPSGVSRTKRTRRSVGDGTCRTRPARPNRASIRVSVGGETPVHRASADCAMPSAAWTLASTWSAAAERGRAPRRPVKTRTETWGSNMPNVLGTCGANDRIERSRRLRVARRWPGPGQGVAGPGASWTVPLARASRRRSVLSTERARTASPSLHACSHEDSTCGTRPPSPFRRAWERPPS